MQKIIDVEHERFEKIDSRLREPTLQERGNGKCDGGFDRWDRAAEIFSLETDNLPDETSLRGVDFSDPAQVLREIQLAYAGGWAVGEHIGTELIDRLLRTRDVPGTRQTLENMAAGSPLLAGETPLDRNVQRFDCSPGLAKLILSLALPTTEEKLSLVENPQWHP